jgi:hypothetical protein
MYWGPDEKADIVVEGQMHDVPIKPVRRRRKRLAVSLRRLLEMLKAGSDLRARKVRRLRAAVRADRYENDLKLSIALDRLIGDVQSPDSTQIILQRSASDRTIRYPSASRQDQ